MGLDWRFQKVNRALCEIVGYSESELLELTFRDITHPDDLEADLSYVHELLAGKISHYHLEKRYIHKQGHAVWILLSGSLVRTADGEPRIFVAEIQDITTQKANEAQLRASVAEKEVLLREIHHRVKNNLQVISNILRLQADRVDAPPIRDIFQDFQGRIQTMALIHDQLYQSKSLATIDFGVHLRELAGMLVRIFGHQERRIRLDFDVRPITLKLDTAIPLGLLANELITNALKHAFVGRTQGTIFVALARNDGELTLTVADDGIGLPADLDFDSGKSLGMRLIKTLSRQLRGQLTVERGSRNAISLTAPIDAGN